MNSGTRNAVEREVNRPGMEVCLHARGCAEVCAALIGRLVSMLSVESSLCNCMLGTCMRDAVTPGRSRSSRWIPVASSAQGKHAMLQFRVDAGPQFTASHAGFVASSICVRAI
eukprot:534431-Pelagomonas_calceolata.AAC.1